MARHEDAQSAFGRLLRIMDDLREHCPWDRKQTLESLRHLSLEEVYELSEAILEGDMDELRGELGDLLLHIVFYAKIADEQAAFTLAEVIHGICDKLVRRHPHVYGDTSATDAEAVSQNWEAIKLQEQARRGRERKSVFDGVPASLPALLKAYRLQEKAAGVGFDWPETKQVAGKVREELHELEATTSNDEAAEEMGDLLFSLVNYARFRGINPVDALEATNRKFLRRFQHIEAQAAAQERPLRELSLAEMEALWQEAKSEPNGSA